jgi:hypothetical protein
MYTASTTTTATSFFAGMVASITSTAGIEATGTGNVYESNVVGPTASNGISGTSGSGSSSFSGSNSFDVPVHQAASALIPAIVIIVIYVLIYLAGLVVVCVCCRRHKEFMRTLDAQQHGNVITYAAGPPQMAPGYMPNGAVGTTMYMGEKGTAPNMGYSPGQPPMSSPQVGAPQNGQFEYYQSNGSQKGMLAPQPTGSPAPPYGQYVQQSPSVGAPSPYTSPNQGHPQAYAHPQGHPYQQPTQQSVFEIG